MSTTFHALRSRPDRRRTTGLLLAAVALLTLLGAPEARAQRRIEFLGGGDGVRALEVTDREQAHQRAAAVRLQGPVSYSRRSGLQMGKFLLQVGRSTAVFPSEGSVHASLDPRALSGREVTVFGRRFGRTIDAQLVIVRPRPHEIETPDPDAAAFERWIIPADTGAPLGRLKNGTPE